MLFLSYHRPLRLLLKKQQVYWPVIWSYWSWVVQGPSSYLYNTLPYCYISLWFCFSQISLALSLPRLQDHTCVEIQNKDVSCISHGWGCKLSLEWREANLKYGSESIPMMESFQKIILPLDSWVLHVWRLLVGWTMASKDV